MMFSTFLSLVALAPLALGAVHEISVGGLNADGTPNLNFYPNDITADIGDVVRFTYHVKNHSVTQSSFSHPCEKLTNAYGALTGFDSGFMPVSNEYGFLPTFEITVNDTSPIWGYCMQVNPPKATHCQSGMVFAVNAPLSGNTFDKYLANAKASTDQNTNSTSTSYSSSVYTSTSSSWNSEVTETDTVTVTETETVTVNTGSSSTSVYWADAPASTTAASPATHTIIVGADSQFLYTPPNITANVGDKVFFSFRQKNHTVTQSSFNDPCRKLSDTTYPPISGFDSGFMFVPPNATYFPNFTITVNDTNPIWGYCRQQAANFSHCGVGMEFSINANPFSDKSFAAFQQIAVTKNGTGFVNPFGNLTAPPAGSYSSYSSYPGGSGSGSKSAQGLDAISGSDSSSGTLSSGDLSKLVSTYAPAALGLLGGVVLLLIVLLVISAVILSRSKKSDASRSFLPSTSYQTVPLTVPHFTGMKDGAHEYEEPRYSDREPGL